MDLLSLLPPEIVATYLHVELPRLARLCRVWAARVYDDGWLLFMRVDWSQCADRMLERYCLRASRLVMPTLAPGPYMIRLCNNEIYAPLLRLALPSPTLELQTFAYSLAAAIRRDASLLIFILTMTPHMLPLDLLLLLPSSYWDEIPDDRLAIDLQLDYFADDETTQELIDHVAARVIAGRPVTESENDTLVKLIICHQPDTLPTLAPFVTLTPHLVSYFRCCDRHATKARLRTVPAWYATVFPCQ